MDLKDHAPILTLQAVLTVVGTVLALYNFVETCRDPASVLGVLFAITYLLAFCVLIAYACSLFKHEGTLPLQLTAYAYLAVLGIQTLQNGQFVPELGLSDGLALFVNVANLVAFANVIKFADKLSDKKMARGYLLAAVALKLAAELTLVVVLIDYVQPVQVLMSLSVPILGATILVAYLNRHRRLNDKASR